MIQCNINLPILSAGKHTAEIMQDGVNVNQNEVDYKRSVQQLIPIPNCISNRPLGEDGQPSYQGNFNTINYDKK